MNKRMIYLLLFVLLILNSCIEVNPNATGPANTPDLTLTVAPPTQIQRPNNTVSLLQSDTPSSTVSQIPLKTKTPTRTPTVQPDAKINFQCLDVTDHQSSEMFSEGMLILDSRVIMGDGRNPRATFELDMSNDELTQVNEINEGRPFFSVSPDRKTIAYKSVHFDPISSDKVIREELVIETVDGQRLKTIAWEEEWSDMPGWLDDQHLVIHLFTRQESTVQMEATFLVYNIFSGERLVLHPHFPEIYDLTDMLEWDGWSITLYDPTLTRVLYLQSPEENTFALALWDLEKERGLLKLEPYVFESSPRWSPDGSRLAVEYYLFEQRATELLLISRDGKVEQLTNLNLYMTADFLNFSWSPDGRYLAAWITQESVYESETAELIVVDTNTRQAIDYCFQVRYRGKGYGGGPPPAPIWSPDSKQLIVRDWYEKDHRRVVLVDRAQGFAVKIAEDMEPVGWMVAP